MNRAKRSRRLVVGLDLAGSPRRPTGYCAMRGSRRITARVLGDDLSILEAVRHDDPTLVVIDAPLSLPHGRATLDDRGGPHLRACDHELLRRGIRFLPLTLGPMRMLTARGMILRSALIEEGFHVVEGYPGGSQDCLGLPRKGGGPKGLQRALVRRGLGGVLLDRPLSHDELDAVTLAWTGQLSLQGRGELIGDPSEGLMLLPAPEERGRARRRTLAVPIVGVSRSRREPSIKGGSRHARGRPLRGGTGGRANVPDRDTR